MLVGFQAYVCLLEIIRGCRTVVLLIAEVEAGLFPLEQRLRNQTFAFWLSIYKLGQLHPY